ncbi:MAG TPA: hypothetical protein VHZ55_10030 [Bryobacteraceae bacterium]|nr:hypothetical protein [Bryobacteraceae bacterium]
MTISSVSNQADLYVPAAPSGTHGPAQTKQQPAQDSVHLSAQAKAAASGDVDHDGDSH